MRTWAQKCTYQSSIIECEDQLKRPEINSQEREKSGIFAEEIVMYTWLCFYGTTETEHLNLDKQPMNRGKWVPLKVTISVDSAVHLAFLCIILRRAYSKTWTIQQMLADN